MHPHPFLPVILMVLAGWMLVSCESKPTTVEEERQNLEDLIRSIGDSGNPKREQAILDLRVFLQSADPQVRFDAAAMLYRMRDRSGFQTLLEILGSQVPVPGKTGVDLRHMAADEFARYREKGAGEVLLSQYEKTKSSAFGIASRNLRLSGMVLHLHESLKEALWYTSVADLAVLDPQYNQALFKRLAENEEASPKQRAAAIFGLAMSGDEAALDRLIAVATNGREALPGNHDDLYLAEWNAAKYLTNFRGERVVKVFEDMLTWKDKTVAPSIALAYLRYRYPENTPSREIIKAGLQRGGWKLGWDYTFLLQLARLSRDPELIALGKKTDYFTSFRELDVRAEWSNAWLEHLLPDWEGDTYDTPPPAPAAVQPETSPVSRNQWMIVVAVLSAFAAWLHFSTKRRVERR